jgi:hypothetical protein
VVVVDASMGLGLGEIFALDSFEVNSKQQIASRFFEEGQSSEDLVKKMSTDSVHADLVYTSIPVVFLFHKQVVYFIMANHLTIPSTLAKKQVPVHKCDRLANDHFKELQRMSMPPVSSPDLNE